MHILTFFLFFFFLAILTAAFPDDVAFMADESMLSTPGIEATDYTLAEYLNFAEHIKACSDRLGKLGNFYFFFFYVFLEKKILILFLSEKT